MSYPPPAHPPYMPGQHQPGKPKGGAGIIVGGIAAVVVVLLGVGATLYFTGFLGAADSGEKPSAQASASPREKPYKHRDDLCQQVDWTPVTDVLELKPEQATGDGAEIEKEADYTNCHLDYGDTSIDPSKELEVFVYVFDTANGAESRYEENRENPLSDASQEAAGDWAQGQFWAGDASSGGDKQWDVGMDVQDENVSVHARIGVPGADSPDEGEQALEAVVKDMLEQLST